MSKEIITVEIGLCCARHLITLADYALKSMSRDENITRSCVAFTQKLIDADKAELEHAIKLACDEFRRQEAANIGPVKREIN